MCLLRTQSLSDIGHLKRVLDDLLHSYYSYTIHILDTHNLPIHFRMSIVPSDAIMMLLVLLRRNPRYKND